MVNNILISTLSKILLICGIILGFYVQFNGTSLVGGGFPAGCIFGSIIILFAIQNS